MSSKYERKVAAGHSVEGWIEEKCKQPFFCKEQSVQFVKISAGYGQLQMCDPALICAVIIFYPIK